jgi:predicted anti-sigma-YlaC factor YlaD
MTEERCQRYLEDPEANAEHLAECEACRLLAANLEADTPDTAIPALNVDRLPLAPWEGAGHRSWGVVVGGSIVVLVIALAVCTWADVPPLRVMQSSLGTLTAMRSTITFAADRLRQASMAWQIAFGLLFVTAGSVLFALLRRAPRGIDA